MISYLVMIVNYDKENGWSTILDSLIKDIPEASEKAKEFFELLSSDPNVQLWTNDELINFAKSCDVSEKSLINFLNSAESGERTLSSYQKYLNETGQATSKFASFTKSAGNVLKTFGSFAVNTAVAMAASWAVGKVIEGIDNYIHRVEIAIEKGEEAKQKIAEISDEYNTKSSFVNGSGERFETLRMGVDIETNENVSLTNEEYSEYLSLCNQVADIYPELVESYDAQGNAILNLGTSAESTTAKLQEMLEVDQEIANIKIADNLQSVYEGAKAQAGQLQSQIDEYKKSAKEYQELVGILDQSNELGIYSQLDKIASGELRFLEIDSNNKELLDSVKNALYENGLYIDQINSPLYDSNGDGIDDKQIINFMGLPDEGQLSSAIEKVKDAIATGVYDISRSASELSSENLFKASSIEKEINAVWNEILPSIQSSLKTNPNYLDLSEEIQNGIMSSVSDIDWSNLDLPDGVELEDYIKENYLYTISGIMNDISDEQYVKDAQNALQEIFTLPTDELTASEYQEVLNKQLQYIETYLNKVGELNGFDGSELYRDFIINLGFKVENEEGRAVDTKRYIQSKLEDLAATEGSDVKSIGLDTLTVDQLMEVNTIVDDTSYGGSVEEAVEQVKAKTQEVVDTTEPIPFSSIISSEDITKQIDDFQSNISSLDDALETLRNGEEIDFTDLVQEFPELAGQTDNLQQAIGNLKTDKLREFSAQWKTAMADLTGEEAVKAQQFLENIISSMDFSDVDLQNYQSIVRNNLSTLGGTGSGSSPLEIWNQLFEKYGNTAEGREALIKLSADPSNVYKTFDELDTLFKDSIVEIELNASEKSILDLQSQMTTLQESAQKVQDDLSLKETKGIKPLVSDYEDLITNSRQQVKNLQNQNAELRIQQNGLDETSAEYRNIESQINANVSAINQARISQLEWNKTIDNLRYDPNEGLMAYNTAKSTRNAGDNYLDMLNAAKEAQEAYNKGLVGTDDFKTVAEMFSPNGMDDTANWKENYGNITRYFTEDVTGVKNALNDLEDANLATQDSMGNWTYSIDDVQKSADTLGISFEAFLAIMGRLQDYGFSNDFFSSVEEGQEHISDLYTELTDAEQKMQELKKARDDGDTTVTDTVLASQEARVNQIKQSILESQDLLAQLASKDAQTYQAEQNAKIQSVLTMAKTSQQLDEQYVQGYLSNIQDTIEENGLEVDLKDLITINDDGSLAINWEEYLRLEKQVGIPLEVTTEFKDAQVEEIKTKLTSAMEDGTSEVQSFVDTIAQYSSEQLGSITFGDGSYGEFEDAERAIDGLLSSLGLSQSEAQTLLTILAEMGKIEYTPEVSTEGVVEETQGAISEAQSTAAENPVVIPTEVETSGETTTVEGGTATLNIEGNNEGAKQSATEAKEFADAQSSEVNVGADTSGAYSDVNKLVDNVSHRFVDINVGANTSGLTTDIDNALSGTRTINVHANVTGLPDSGGVALGTAHANGTVLDMWNNYRASIGAYAKGNNWALPRNETALVNELGKFMLSINLFNCWKLLRVLQTTT